MSEFGCRDCGARWGGLLTCHCPACHETFAVPSTFDRHRLNYKCVDPRKVGLIQDDRSYPCWKDTDEA